MGMERTYARERTKKISTSAQISGGAISGNDMIKIGLQIGQRA
jgi:hypothetical protein